MSEALGGRFGSPPAVASWGANRLDIFGLDTNKQMFHKAWIGDQWWPSQTEWKALGGRFGSPPAVVSWGGNRLDIFAVSTDKQMDHRQWNGDRWWPSTWETLRGGFISPPAVASWGHDRLDIFAVGTDKQMFHIGVYRPFPCDGQGGKRWAVASTAYRPRLHRGAQTVSTFLLSAPTSRCYTRR
jgi:hypothetical protein